MYGRDRGSRRGGLAELLGGCTRSTALEWIRLLYLYPATVDSELIDAIADAAEGLQVHGHAAAARAPRGAACDAPASNGERYLEILDDFRRRIPDVTMRSTFIVGFPGEREEHVDYLEEWLRSRANSTASVSSAIAARKGPPARLPDQVPESEKRRRLVRLREAQRVASERARARASAGPCACWSKSAGATHDDPLRERSAARATVGRSMGEAPGVDGAIAFAGAGRARIVRRVRLEGRPRSTSYGRRHSDAVAVAFEKRIEPRARTHVRRRAASLGFARHDRLAYSSARLRFVGRYRAVAYIKVARSPPVAPTCYFVPKPRDRLRQGSHLVLLARARLQLRRQRSGVFAGRAQRHDQASRSIFRSKPRSVLSVPRDTDAIVQWPRGQDQRGLSLRRREVLGEAVVAVPRVAWTASIAT